MPIPDYIDHFVEFAACLANLLVFGFTVTTYQRTGKRCLLLIGISAGIGAVLAIAPWLRPDEPSWFFWGFWSVATLTDLILWVIGLRLLVKEYVEITTRIAQPNTLPNGHPAIQPGNSNATKRPSTVN